jgi:hypothetical protein
LKVSNLISELNANYQLRELLRTNLELKAQYIYKLNSKIDCNLTYTFSRKLFSRRCFSRKTKGEIIIVDSTSVAIYLNTWRNKHMIGKINKKYKYSYDHSHGYNVEFKHVRDPKIDSSKIQAPKSIYD